MENFPIKEIASEFSKLFDLVNKEKPAGKDVDALRSMIKKHPDLWKLPGGFADQNILRLLGETHMTDAVRMLFRSNIEGMKTNLGYDSSSELEKMLIDSLLLAWLRLNIYEYTMTMLESQGISFEKGSFWEKRVSSAQSRYLRVCRTLALVRRLARNIPALQLNIAAPGGQQLNIVGDVIREESTSDPYITNQQDIHA